MRPLPLHELHASLSAAFTEVNGCEVVASYGDPAAEYAALKSFAVVADLSCRGRLVLMGADRQKFLNGQVTNQVGTMASGDGCYATLTTAKGKMESDLNIFCLENELLLDFEPGYAESIASRLDKYVIADDVQIVDAAPHYGLISVLGPKASDVVQALSVGWTIPTKPHSFARAEVSGVGELYLMNLPRSGAGGFDLYIPTAALGMVADKLIAGARAVGGCAAGWTALEVARIESGVPRFGVDMDESNLPPEAGLENRAVSYTKGCYIGQEVIARLRTYGQVSKALRVLKLSGDGPLPVRGDAILREGKPVGTVTSSVLSPAWGAPVALGYVRRECNSVGTELAVRLATGERPATIVALPYGASEKASAGRGA